MFDGFVSENSKDHPRVEADILWITGRLENAPKLLGDVIPGLTSSLPVYKARLKDSCCKTGAQGGWRLFYAVNEAKSTVTLLMILHKKQCENPSAKYINQHLVKAGFA